MVFGLHKVLRNRIITVKEKCKSLISVITVFFVGQNLYTLEQQRLNAILFLFAIVLFISNIFNIFSKYPAELIIVQFLLFILILTLYFFSRFNKRLKRIEAVFFYL